MRRGEHSCEQANRRLRPLKWRGKIFQKGRSENTYFFSDNSPKILYFPISPPDFLLEQFYNIHATLETVLFLRYFALKYLAPSVKESASPTLPFNLYPFPYICTLTLQHGLFFYHEVGGSKLPRNTYTFLSDYISPQISLTTKCFEFKEISNKATLVPIIH
jgi:hypothetical protein